MKKIILVSLLFVSFCAFASFAIAQTTNTQTLPVMTNTTTGVGSGSVTQSPTACKQGEIKYYTCPNVDPKDPSGGKVNWCTCSDNGMWICVMSVENKCNNTCVQGQTKKYVCGDGKQVDWCTCDANGKWVCIISPENKCQTVQNCQAGCICNGGLTACPTVNKPVTTQVTTSSSATTTTTSETQQSAQPTISVATISIEKTATGSSVIKSGNIQATSSEKIKVVENKLYLETSDSKNEEVKIMPSTVSETAIERLGEVKNVQIELKEVGEVSATKPAYELTAEKSVKVLGLFPANVKIITEINAQTGSITSVKKPWWSFLAW